MSSWANRHLPRKRDLSQIPEPFRPTIVPRVDRPEVILSESFQMKYDNGYGNSAFTASDDQNEVIYPKPSFLSMFNKPVDRTVYPVKKIETAPRISAKELTYDGKSYVFVMLRNLRTTRDNDLWITSYNKIRQFYTNKIVIIDDNSSINTVNGKLVNTEVIMSEWNGAGEILPYYYYLKHRWADRMIFLHDSMFLSRPFSHAELDGAVKFHWYFANKDLGGKFSTYLSLLKNHEALVEYAAGLTWKGCFGGAAMIDFTVVQQLEETYALFSKLVSAIRSRKERELFERILGIVLYYEHLVDDTTCSNFGEITKYPGAFESDQNNFETAAHRLSQAGYDTAIIKVWRGR